jgi:hypothetical protein
MCIACGVDSGHNYFCQPCWRATPSALKTAWWQLTLFGTSAPTDWEVAEFVEKRKGRKGPQ